MSPLAPAAHPVQCRYWCLVFAAVTLHLETEAKYTSIPQATFIGGGSEVICVIFRPLPINNVFYE